MPATLNKKPSEALLSCVYRTVHANVCWMTQTVAGCSCESGRHAVTYLNNAHCVCEGVHVQNMHAYPCACCLICAKKWAVRTGRSRPLARLFALFKLHSARKPPHDVQSEALFDSLAADEVRIAVCGNGSQVEAGRTTDMTQRTLVDGCPALNRRI